MIIEPDTRHNELFCGCVEKEKFLPALRYIYERLNEKDETRGQIVNHQELSEKMDGSMAAYLLLTVLENSGILEHGSSIRNCWATGEWVNGEYVKPIQAIKALILECQVAHCPDCMPQNHHVLDVEYGDDCKPHYWCHSCEKVITFGDKERCK